MGKKEKRKVPYLFSLIIIVIKPTTIATTSTPFLLDIPFWNGWIVSGLLFRVCMHAWHAIRLRGVDKDVDTTPAAAHTHIRALFSHTSNYISVWYYMHMVTSIFADKIGPHIPCIHHDRRRRQPWTLSSDDDDQQTYMSNMTKCM